MESPDQQHNETYATTASFLLRLLVDDKHVCLVAVAKPIPEPTDLPSPFSIKPLASLPSSLGGSPSAAAASPSPSPSPLSSSPSSLSDASESLFSAPRGQDHAPSTFTGATTVSLGPEHSPSFSSEHYDGPRSELAGPTEVAPPSVVKVMAAPPPRGRTNPHTETVVGVASASLNVIRPGNDDFFGTLDEDSETETSLHPDTDADGSHTPRPEQPRSRSSTRTGNKVAKEAHILTLSILPSERSQGLGARLLDALLQECQVRSKSVGRRLIAPSSSSSPTTSTSSPAASKVGEEKGKKHGESGEVVQTLRTYLEVHPSNRRAIELYRSRGFQRPDGERGFRKGFYRGDIRIPVQERLKAGGMDAWVMERFS
ncbi:hypothetical protein IE53DRAFT_369395 [Violaceomyces palustris]|uniref:Uncharacterized protein n=1 Tax=Violaceomyces palustris TaxID=1673888 RepID=A0ACD0NVL7_9BASI|nr:hypothetical protein IE53DRAFT_369395 [Violaceomyces palustris]